MPRDQAGQRKRRRRCPAAVMAYGFQALASSNSLTVCRTSVQEGQRWTGAAATSRVQRGRQGGNALGDASAMQGSVLDSDGPCRACPPISLVRYHVSPRTIQVRLRSRSAGQARI
nr:hypothetical protein CFP56_04197 [Quercus suber]